LPLTPLITQGGEFFLWQAAEKHTIRIRARLNRLRKNTKFGNRIALDNGGKSATSAASENAIIANKVPKTHFSAACSGVP